MIDYERMKKVWPKQKAALTRAKRKGYAAVLDVSRKAIREWNEIGAWPDDWSRFQRALDDASFEAQRKGEKFAYVRFQDLE